MDTPGPITTPTDDAAATQQNATTAVTGVTPSPAANVAQNNAPNKEGSASTGAAQTDEKAADTPEPEVEPIGYVRCGKCGQNIPIYDKHLIASNPE